MANYAAYFIDLDGTIYQGAKQFPTGKRFIERLQATNTDYLFVTNNSTKTPEDVATNLTNNHQIKTSPEQVYTSAMATADYVKELGLKHVMLLGEIGIEQALLAQDIELVASDEPELEAVVVALDRELTYEKLAQATLAIRTGAKFIATNADTNLPNERGMLPGAGTILAALKTATQVEPIIVGKPEKIIMEQALKYADKQAQETVMVGDNYNTDILAGINSDMATLLVYSGVSTPESVHQESVQPTHEVASLDDWIL